LLSFFRIFLEKNLLDFFFLENFEGNQKKNFFVRKKIRKILKSGTNPEDSESYGSQELVREQSKISGT